MKDIKTVIFDYDGTLHNSTRIYADAFRIVYERMVEDGAAPKRDFTDDEITKWLGYSAMDMWQAFMPELSVEDRVYYSKEIGQIMTEKIQNKQAVLYDGALETLAYLKNKGYHVLYLSNCGHLFMSHHGFDFDQIKKAITERNEGRRKRGASTISQQTAKNVFLWNGGGWLRKGLEAYFTVLIELLWGKERIMEVYLNSIEMGYGLYGVEATSRENFRKKARKLTGQESALIAATLPNPLRFDSARPSSYMFKRQKQILSLMKKIEKVEMGAEK